MVEQLSISLDKAKVALAECCTDGSAHASLSLSLFQQAISKLDETRYMVRRSLDDAKRSERPTPEQHQLLRKSYQDKAAPQIDSKAPQDDSHSISSPPDPLAHERFLKSRAARKDENSSSAGGLGAPVRRRGDQSIPESVSPDHHGETLAAQTVVRPSSAASTRPPRSRRDAPPFAFSTRPSSDPFVTSASPPFLGITKTLSPQPIESDLRDRSPGARSRSAHSERAADEELQTARDDGVRRGSMARHNRTPPKDSDAKERARSSSRVRHSSPSSETSLSGEDEIPPIPKSRTHSASSRRKTPDESQGDVSQVVPSQRLWTRGPAPSSRRALDLASAPPQSDGEDADFQHADFATVRRTPTSLRGKGVVAAIVAAASAYPGSERLDLERSLALVSQEYRQAAQAELFRNIRLTKSRQLDLLVPIFEKNATLASAVKTLSLSGLGPGKGSRSGFLDQIRRLLAPLHNLESLDEDLSIPDWDIVDYKENDYILSPTSRCRLKSFRSASSWWEILALHALLTEQRELESVVIGGAVVDREWAATKLMTQGLASPAKNLKRLEVAQVLHEDTLLVLLTATGGKEGSLWELDLGFQSIDEETPRTSIVSAFRSAGQGLGQLTLHAPSQVSAGDLTGFLDEIVAELPQLESIEWSENSTSAARIPLASARFLEHLPTNLRRLKARSLVSLSTSKVLAMLEEPEKVPSLAELEIEWGAGRGDERGREPWYRERHIARIEDAAADLGIACRVGKSKRTPQTER